MKKYLVLLVVFLIAKSSISQGGLDLTFNGTGMAYTLIDDYAMNKDLVIQPDGKIVLAGYSSIGGMKYFAVVRYNTDGTLDHTFDGDGIVTTSFDPASTSAMGQAVAIQNDGKIVVAGIVFWPGRKVFGLARYNTDGSLDATFDGDGLDTASCGPGSEGRTLAIQPDGKLVVAGFNPIGSYNQIAIIRFTSSGTLDNTFDGDGKCTTFLSSISFTPSAIAIDASNKIVIAGGAGDGVNDDFMVARYNSDGSPDVSFSGDGLEITDVGSSNEMANDMTIQADGKIILAGYGYYASSIALVTLARYSSSGILDNTFSGDGIVYTDIGPHSDYGWGVALQADGKIVLGATIHNVVDYFALVRYNTNGSVADSVITDLGGYNDAHKVAIQTDGKIVVSGQHIDSLSRFIAVRYDPAYLFASENTSTNEIKVYPNPASNRINFQMNCCKNLLVRICNLNGQTVFNQKGGLGNSFSIDVSAFEAAVYFIEISDGNTVYRTKFVKQ
jgi:serralysin